MGYLNFDHDKETLNRIKSAMKRRGLFVDPEDDWEIHGPHQDMNYQVFIGPVYEGLNVAFPCSCKIAAGNTSFCKRHNGKAFWVTIYPRAVYATDDWSNIDPQDKISINWR